MTKQKSKDEKSYIRFRTFIQLFFVAFLCALIYGTFMFVDTALEARETEHEHNIDFCGNKNMIHNKNITNTGSYYTYECLDQTGEVHYFVKNRS